VIRFPILAIVADVARRNPSSSILCHIGLYPCRHEQDAVRFPILAIVADVARQDPRSTLELLYAGVLPAIRGLFDLRAAAIVMAKACVAVTSLVAGEAPALSDLR
jgi:hypothetical protein